MLVRLYSPTVDRRGNPGSQLSPVKPQGVQVHDNLIKADSSSPSGWSWVVPEPPIPFLDEPEPKSPETLEEWLAEAYPEGSHKGPEMQAKLKAASRVIDKRAKLIEQQWEAEERAEAYRPSGMSLGDFLGEEEPPPDWVIPGLLERQDRIIVTGLEGSGKSVLSRQIAVCAAAGVHPFDLAMLGVKPIRVMYVDLENPESEVRRSLRMCAAAAGPKLDPSNLTVVARPEGMDLVGNDGAELRKEIAESGQPDLLIIGPLYKMVAKGDVTEEPVARELTATLDRLRIEMGFALWIEAHAPHQTVTSKNDPSKLTTRPYGASLFKRWPEFGYFLHYDDESGDAGMRRWRQDRRAGRRWPYALRRGGRWPWTSPMSEEDAAWTPVQDAVEKYAAENKGDTPSIRALADMVHMTKSTLDRFLKDNADRLVLLKAAMLQQYGPPPRVPDGQLSVDVGLSHEDQKGETP